MPPNLFMFWLVASFVMSFVGSLFAILVVWKFYGNDIGKTLSKGMYMGVQDIISEEEKSIKRTSF